ncbi:ERF family protein [Pantoea sp.]|uniref:ERF family protein n=1 Tax=Pantoea sp. TaxID=69393 RepID=UPI0028A5AF79|nr:ERF family protein [Pantoea sp.]
MSKEFYARLAEIQRTLNAPKNQYNSFGKYSYRSCEDILEGVKPLLAGLFLSISDEVVLIGDRYYVRATASITDGDVTHTASAMAREEESKKGMDAAQLTGATSSYARKYCLNGLFGIDDAKDADTNEHRQQGDNSSQKKPTGKATLTRSADDILADFTAQAAECQTLDDLKGIYRPAWNALSSSAEHQHKCESVFKARGSELKKAA